MDEIRRWGSYRDFVGPFLAGHHWWFLIWTLLSVAGFRSKKAEAVGQTKNMPLARRVFASLASAGKIDHP